MMKGGEVSNEPTGTSNWEITGTVETTDAEGWGGRNYYEMDGQMNGNLEDESNEQGLLRTEALWKGRKASGWKGERSEGRRYAAAESRVCFSGPQSITATLWAGMATDWSTDGRSAERQSSAGHTGGLA